MQLAKKLKISVKYSKNIQESECQQKKLQLHEKQEECLNNKVNMEFYYKIQISHKNKIKIKQLKYLF